MSRQHTARPKIAGRRRVRASNERATRAGEYWSYSTAFVLRIRFRIERFNVIETMICTHAFGRRLDEMKLK